MVFRGIGLLEYQKYQAFLAEKLNRGSISHTEVRTFEIKDLYWWGRGRIAVGQVFKIYNGYWQAYLRLRLSLATRTQLEGQIV